MAHRLIEEFMLAANRAVAHTSASAAIPALHRVHEKPDARKVLEFEELARAFGYSLGVENLHQREVTVRHGTVTGSGKGRPSRFPRRGREARQRVALPGAEVDITPQHYQRLVEEFPVSPKSASSPTSCCVPSSRRVTQPSPWATSLSASMSTRISLRPFAAIPTSSFTES